MHPDDCAELVNEEVDALRAAIPGWTPNLNVDDVRLGPGLNLYVVTRIRSYGTLAATASSPVLLPGGQRVEHQVQVLDLGSRRDRALTVHAECDDFDGQPPLIDLLDASGAPLPGSEWPKDPRGPGVVPNHPRYQRPFFCRPGVREYHEHPQHEDDPWDRHREGYSLHRAVLGVLSDIHTRFVV